MSWCSCSVRCWKRATLVLAVLSLMLLLLISSALRCDLLDREEGVQPRGQRGSRGQGGSGRPQDKRKYAEEGAPSILQPSSIYQHTCVYLYVLW